MPDLNPAALDFLLHRRSRPSKTLALPVPTQEQLVPMLTAAARSPDHGKLEPWRFIVLEEGALRRLSNLVHSRGEALGKDSADIDKASYQFASAHLVVAVVECQKSSAKVPAIEQTYSAGAVCLAMLNAALASGWGANWLSGWASHDRGFVEVGLGLNEDERIAGFIHLGTETTAPPERPRPNLDEITAWMAA
ncbi:nitroreductase [Roseovarius sp. EL26]|uniref:nitroreductase family protein n=1 Tax=Roseovarius sp. EL26 TaxID=2126672 RepID=UPI000EA206F5|nr:nitroreductase [Roseovarius sp. EL26]